jgi:iron complex transport system ATP-binding protein
VDYRGREVVHGCHFASPPASGGSRRAERAGKSTLLRLVAGTLAPSGGRVRLCGDDIARLERREVATRLAVVPQLATLPFAATVEQVVALGRLPHEPFRGPREADRLAVAAAIERVGVGELVGRDARELSLGERQLVLIALAVAQAAPVLLLDEPTVHLDLRHRVEAMDLLRDLNERDGSTVVAVLHDLHLAARFFPRIVLLDRGAVVVDGRPRRSSRRIACAVFVSTRRWPGWRASASEASSSPSQGQAAESQAARSRRRNRTRARDQPPIAKAR